MNGNPILLFRKPGSHIFMTTRDPEFRYEILCSHCEYPITETDSQCPRCRRFLEKCPVCSDRTHTRAPRPESDVHGGKTCSVCHVYRLPFGDMSVTEIKGAFCSNFYGCPAGGLLLQSDEFAVLKHGSTCCPVCKSATLHPFDVKTFIYHIQRCVLCSNIFRPMAKWQNGWGRGGDALEEFCEPPDELAATCPLCGFRNQESGSATDANRVLLPSVDTQGHSATNELSRQDFLHLAELARLLILSMNMQDVFSRSFEIWFDPKGAGDRRDGRMTVSETARLLLEGTSGEQRRLLNGRLQEFLAAWERNLPGGQTYRIPTPSLKK